MIRLSTWRASDTHQTLKKKPPNSPQTPTLHAPPASSCLKPEIRPVHSPILLGLQRIRFVLHRLHPLFQLTRHPLDIQHTEAFLIPAYPAQHP
jgi:hypothetical protein